MKKIFCVILVIFLTGCSSQKANEPKKQENSTNHTTSMKSSTNHYSSSTETSSNNKLKKTSESASTAQASSKSKNEVSTNVEETNSLEATPYAVDLSSLNNPLVFNFKGMNVPTSITLENLNSTPTATFRTKLFGAENGQVKEAINKYELSINTIPTKEIRIFSAADNSIRTVKVNTELILGTNISSNDEQNRSGTLYLFNNKNGSKSLITPNYAGNVTDDQKDVMLEVIQ